ncbi:MAG: hypothetical protein M3Y77_15995 [Actinomycetota bacterium]|nr:hypothetical protein [Actinomycetota bacterium]
MTQTSSGVTSFASEGDPRSLTQYRLSELLAQVTDGQLEALGRLYDLTVPLVFQLSATILERDLVAAELVTQQVFAELWQQAKSYHPSSQSPLTFVMSLARRVAEATVADATVADATAAAADDVEAAG